MSWKSGVNDRLICIIEASGEIYYRQNIGLSNSLGSLLFGKNHLYEIRGLPCPLMTEIWNMIKECNEFKFLSWYIEQEVQELCVEYERRGNIDIVLDGGSHPAIESHTKLNIIRAVMEELSLKKPRLIIWESFNFN